MYAELLQNILPEAEHVTQNDITGVVSFELHGAFGEEGCVLETDVYRRLFIVFNAARISIDVRYEFADGILPVGVRLHCTIIPKHVFT